MTNEPEAMREIHDIRLQIYEETKGMTAEQRADHANKAAEELVKKHGITLNWAKEIPAHLAI
ncbi:MAG: hypothetical protein LBS74_03630 [Oscillospiraceae bacterium]|jgi:hypothetical protein|nr:hypothetical protein [Oscillospiraceae bacterium]